MCSVERICHSAICDQIQTKCLAEKELLTSNSAS